MSLALQQSSTLDSSDLSDHSRLYFDKPFGTISRNSDLSDHSTLYLDKALGTIFRNRGEINGDSWG